MKFKKQYVYILIIAFFLGFIILNSLMNPSLSYWISHLPRRIVQLVIPYGKVKWLDAFLIIYIRKFAHMFEYAVLAAFVIKVLYISKKSLQAFMNAFFIILSVAIVDETIQIFTKRESSVADVWLDMLGAIIGFAVCIVVCKIVKMLRKKANNKKHGIDKHENEQK